MGLLLWTKQPPPESKGNQWMEHSSWACRDQTLVDSCYSVWPKKSHRLYRVTTNKQENSVCKSFVHNTRYSCASLPDLSGRLGKAQNHHHLHHPFDALIRFALRSETRDIQYEKFRKKDVIRNILLTGFQQLK